MPLLWHDFLPATSKPDLETMLSQFLGVPFVQVECSGTACLVIALELLKQLSPRRTVLIPAYTCPLVPLAVAHAGLQVRLCDTRPDSFDMDLDCLRRQCDDSILCVVPTHLGGLVSDLEPVVQMARQAGAYVIEDAAQALGATWRGKTVGTVGDIGFYSLARGKGLTVYEGGILVAQNAQLRSGLREISQGIAGSRPGIELLRLIQLVGYCLLYNPTALSLAYGAPLRYWLSKGDPVRAVGDDFSEDIPLHKMSSLRKLVAASALKRLPETLAGNVERGQRRAADLNSIPGLKVIADSPDGRGTWPFLTVLCDTAEARDLALAELWSKGLGVSRLFIHDLAGYPFLARVVPSVPMPNARSLSARTLTISNSAWLTDSDFSRIRDTLAASM